MIPYLIAAVGGYLIGSSMKTKKFADGGMFEEPIPAIMDNYGNIKSEKKLQQDLEYLKEAYKDRLITKNEYDESYNEIQEQIKLLQKEMMAKGGEVKYKIGDKVKIDYISDYNKHNGEVGEITWLNEAKYYPKGDYSVVEKRTQAEITYKDGSTEMVSDLYTEGSGLVSPVKKVTK